MFATATKNDTTPLSREELRRICRSVEVPAVAIGGITAADVEAILATGVTGIALSGALLGAASPAEETRRIMTILNQHKQ